jgi:nitric oxide reductase subunit B
MAMGGKYQRYGHGRQRTRGQAKGVNLLLIAVVIVALGSLLGEMLGVYQLLGKLWFWFGHQGWEYLDLGRAWQILLAIGLIIWMVLIFRGVGPARKNSEEREISTLFLLAALAIPLFYLPAMFFTGRTHYTVVDNWRFWIIHLWVEGFFELFVTTMVAILFYKLGMVSRLTDPDRLPRCHPLSRRRNHRDSPPLVLDRAIDGHDGPCGHLLRHGGCATHTSHTRCLGFHKIDKREM